MGSMLSDQSFPEQNSYIGRVGTFGPKEGVAPTLNDNVVVDKVKALDRCGLGRQLRGYRKCTQNGILRS